MCAILYHSASSIMMAYSAMLNAYSVILNTHYVILNVVKNLEASADVRRLCYPVDASRCSA